jgi:hypothetical protein
MKRLLFITTDYIPKASPNGICVHEISAVLRTMGYEISVLCPHKKGELKQESIDGVNVYRIHKPLFLRMMDYGEVIQGSHLRNVVYKAAIVIQYVRLFIYLAVYPVTSIAYLLNHYKYALKLHKQNKYDGVISTYNSIEAVFAGMRLKKRNKTLKLGLYVLDSLSNRGAGQFLYKRFIDKKGWIWEKRLYEQADKVFNLKCHEQHHLLDRYKPYRNKMEIVDFPLLKKPKSIPMSLNDTAENNVINFVYTGSLQSSFRSPRYVCDVFASINLKKYTVSFYSRGDSEQLLQQYERCTNGIILRKGFIERQKSLQIINNAQVLISIGNKNTDMVPSKTFEYMATGKPIIHFYSNEMDSCLPYYINYPLSLLINEDASLLKENADRITEFISNAGGKTLQYEEVESMFPLSTPIYTARKFDEMMNE